MRLRQHGRHRLANRFGTTPDRNPSGVPYHFWTYVLDGALCGCQGEEAYVRAVFDRDIRPTRGAVRVCPRLVFVTSTPDLVRSRIGYVPSDHLPEPPRWQTLIPGLGQSRTEDAITGRSSRKTLATATTPFVHPFLPSRQPLRASTNCSQRASVQNS